MYLTTFALKFVSWTLIRIVTGSNLSTVTLNTDLRAFSLMTLWIDSAELIISWLVSELIFPTAHYYGCIQAYKPFPRSFCVYWSNLHSPDKKGPMCLYLMGTVSVIPDWDWKLILTSVRSSPFLLYERCLNKKLTKRHEPTWSQEERAQSYCIIQIWDHQSK